MTVNKTVRRLAALLGLLVVVSGCALREGRPTVWERERRMVAQKSVVPQGDNVTASEKDWRPDVHVVQKGETLYGIAFNYGLDYHEIAELNSIQNPSVISIGQELRLFDSAVSSGGAPMKSITESEPSENINTATSFSTISPVTTSSLVVVIKEQPIVLKLDYSEQAVTQIEKLQAEQLRPGTKTSAQLSAAPSESTGESTSGRRAQIVEVDDRELDWGLPAQGKWSNEFSGGSNRRGIDIAGKLGQPVVASAAGKVVYSGSGLRGYGNLVIIKHNKTFISAYAHNDKVVVKEGQAVSKGQKIAEMGNTDTNQVKLHFEIRKFGKPVDPANFLSLPKT
ncbi:MAG: peptidoglycan DD-metalloendopeptidase family protein [Candidatus Nitrotoga sp.]